MSHRLCANSTGNSLLQLERTNIAPILNVFIYTQFDANYPTSTAFMLHDGLKEGALTTLYFA